MANAVFLAMPPSDLGAFSGGSWLSTLPLSNLITQQPTEIARTTDLATASTKFQIDFATVTPITMVSWTNHNMTSAARVRLRLAGGTGTGFDVTVDGRESNIVFGQLPWGAFPWDGFSAKGVPAGGQSSFYLNPSYASGTTLYVEITDPTNPDGYVQIGRFMAGVPMQPKYNFVYGAALSVIDDTTITRSAGGSLWADVKPRRRKLSLSYDSMREGDAWGFIHDYENQLGIAGNLFAVYNPTAPEGVRVRGMIYGHLDTLNGVVTANASLDAPYTATLSIEELI